MRIKFFLGLCFLIFLVSCSVNEKVTGKYRSNFASLGFFITEIELKPDNTFHYDFSGDLQHTELDGVYKIEKNNLYLLFNKLKGETEPGAIKIVGNDTIIDFEKLGKSHSYEIKKENGIEYHLKYKISKNKLQSYNIQTDKLVKRAKKYSNKKRYIVFGPKYHKKKWFLKKLEK
jgi:hypothetical protein